MKRWISMVLALQTGLMTVLAAMAFFLGKPNIVSTGLWAASLLVFLAGWASLGRSLTMSPVPNKRGLRTTGIYRLVRHPMYFSLLLFGIGTAFSVVWAVFPLALLAFVLHVKIDAEERLLEETYEGYSAYKAQTKRLIPFLW